MAYQVSTLRTRVQQKLELSNGDTVLLDSVDYERIQSLNKKWHRSYYGYAVAHEGKGIIYMHRYILDAPIGSMVDHKNMNRLDNRRSNLRLATKAQNMRNTGLRKDNKSGYKGVHWVESMKKWLVNIRIDNKSKHIGYFSDKEQAALAYNEAAIKFFGEFARLNEVKL